MRSLGFLRHPFSELPGSLRYTLAAIAIWYALTCAFLLALTPLLLTVGRGEPRSIYLDLFGFTGALAEGTGLHIIQVCIIFVLMGLIHLAARLAKRKYVHRWTFAWLGLFLYYAYESLSGIFTGMSLGDDLDFPLTFILFATSTYFILLTGLQIKTENGLSPHSEVLLAAFFLILLLLPLPLAMLPGLAAASILANSNAAMACVATIFAGIMLHHESKRSRSSNEMPGGSEVIPVFLAYGLLQIGSAWLEGASWATLLYAAALILKVPCSLSVVAIALRKAFRENEEREQQVKSKRDQLAQALKSVAEVRRVEMARSTALTRVDSELSTARTSHGSLQQLVEVVSDILGASVGLLLLPYRGGSTGTQSLIPFVTRGPSLDQHDVLLTVVEPTRRSLDGTRTALTTGMLIEASRRLLPEDMSGARAYTLNLSGLSAAAYLLVANEEPPAQELPDAALEELLKKGETSFELSFLRELGDLDEKLRELSGGELDLRRHLNELAKQCAQAINARELILELRDEQSVTDHLGFYSARNEEALRLWGGENDADGQAVSPYPTTDQWLWYDTEGRTADGHSTSRQVSFQRSILRVPLNNGRGITGVVICEDKQHPEQESLVCPFTELDAVKVRKCGEAAAAAVEREMRRQNIERLIAQNIHELRQSVSSLRNIIRWLTKTLMPEAESKLWRKLSDAKTDVTALGKIVSYVDIYHENVVEPREEVQVFGEIVMKAAAGVRERLQRFGIPRSRQKIEFRHVAIVPTLCLEKSFLQHIVSNLVDNAFKYKDPGRKVFRLVFEGDVDDLYYMIRVKDWGIGIPEEWGERIFSEGERAPNAVQQVHPGKGMGLSISKLYAKKLGGILELVSTRNPTEFVLKLPKELRA